MQFLSLLQGRFWLGDGEVQQRLSGLAERLASHGGAGQAEKIKRHAGQHDLDALSEVEQTVKDLQNLESDTATLSKAGISVKEVDDTLKEVEELRRRMAAAAAKAPPTGTREETLKRAETLFVTYKKQTQLALDTIYRDGYADFIDTFGGTDRIRPDDAADAMLRLNASIWTVLRDVRNGSLGPRAFGKSNWNEVDGKALYELGRSRLYNDELDYDKVTAEMAKDPAWRQKPIMIHQQGEEPAELKFDNISSVWKRSIYSAVAPNEAAESVEALKISQRIRDAAIAVTDKTEDDTAAVIDVAYSLYKGEGLAGNASQAGAALIIATGINPFSGFDLTPPGTTVAQLEELRKGGQISGYKLAPNGKQYVTYTDKTVLEACAEIKMKLDKGQLGNLPAATRRKIAELIGPANAPGEMLSKRIESEDSGRYWREFSSEAVQFVAIALASGGAGAAAGGFAEGIKAGPLATRGLKLASMSGTWTTLQGMTKGKLKPEDYLIDLAIFGAFGAVSRFIKIPFLKK